MKKENEATGRAPLTRWKGRAFIGVGRALYIGPAWDTAPHSHHAIQICCGLEGGFGLRSEPKARWSRYDGVLVPSDHEHQLDGKGSPLLLIYLEPETPEGRFLQLLDAKRRIRSLEPDQMRRVRSIVGAAMGSNFGASRARELIDDVLKLMGFTGSAPASLDSRVLEAVRRLRSHPEKRQSLGRLAHEVELSPSRFRHLFFEGMGISCRRYVLWLRLNAAIEEAARGKSLTGAALAAGFADAPHLTRTFRRMLGIAPSSIVPAISPME